MISVCMATYNGEKYVKRQLESILIQLSNIDEVIVSDDGSRDQTVKMIQDMHDPRIKIFHNKGIHGFTHNFENALKQAQGDYIFLSDQDDIWMDNKVSNMMEALKTVDFVSSDCITVDENMNVLQISRFDAFGIKLGFFNHLIKSRYLGCCMAFRKSVLNACLPFPKNDSLIEHDIWIAAVAFLYFKSALIKQPLIYYCRHGENASLGGFDKGYPLLNKIYRRIYRLICLICVFFRKKIIFYLR